MKDCGPENYEKNVNRRNAFSHDINKCLFDDWVTKGIIRSQVTCNLQNHAGLCYGLINRPALFISCYNSGTRIPAFSAHVVRPAKKTIFKDQASAKKAKQPKITKPNIPKGNKMTKKIKKMKNTKIIKKPKFTRKIKNTKKIIKYKKLSVNRLSWKKDTGTCGMYIIVK